MTAYSDEDVIEMLRQACEELNPKGAWRGGRQIWAKKNGISTQYLSEILQGKKEMPEWVARKLDDRLRRLEGYVRIPKERRKKENWTFEELMEHTNYSDN